MKKLVKVLCIAGSDSSAGAGIQADIKTIAACGGYAATIITALTAQNTQKVDSAIPVSINMIKSQFNTVLRDFTIDAIKIGMLFDAEIIEIVSKMLSQIKYKPPIVLDPVMVSTSGDMLLEKDALDILKKELIPMSTVITPNIKEACVLLNKNIKDFQNINSMSILLSKHFGVNTIIKGGHSNNENHCLDILCLIDTLKTVSILQPRIKTKNTHGTGCSLSSALACFLGQEYDIKDAFKHANNYVHKAIYAGKDYQWKGHGPINHFFDHSL